MTAAVPDTDQSATPLATERSASSSSPGLLALEGGLVLAGALGAHAAADGELVFTTAATGWGEIVSDPSYAGQIVVLTHPMAGSYRIAASELESTRVRARGLVVSRLVDPPPGDGVTLRELLAADGVPVIAGIDTRALTLVLRNGAGTARHHRAGRGRGGRRPRARPRQHAVGRRRPRDRGGDPRAVRRGAGRGAACASRRSSTSA